MNSPQPMDFRILRGQCLNAASTIVGGELASLRGNQALSDEAICKRVFKLARELLTRAHLEGFEVWTNEE